MGYKIDSIHEAEYPEVVELWEASVRATHHFLSEEDIALFKPLILNEYLKAVELTCVRSEDNKIIGFAGVSEGKMEMLFIHPDTRGRGVGKLLLNNAVESFGVNEVDVNEDNQQAVGFYKHAGFKMIGRSERDGMGKPYPLLHMKLI